MIGAAASLALALATLLGPGPSSGPEQARATALRRVQEAEAPDAWFGDDKFRHLAMSTATVSLSAAALRTVAARDAATPAGAIVALAAGVGKELYDVRSGSFFSARDLAWDVAGVLVGYALARQAR